MPEEVIMVTSGALSSKREWQLVVCAKPDERLVDGRHLILVGAGQPTPEELTPEELREFRLLAFDLAEAFASEPGRWRVDFNGPGVATRPHIHIHIKLPAGGDKLARLVG